MVRPKWTHRKDDWMRPVHTLPSYSFGGHEIFDTIGEYTKQLGKKTVIIGGDTSLSVTLPFLQPALETAGVEVLEVVHFGGECAYAVTNELAKKETLQSADFLIGVGGGKALDTTKLTSIALGDIPVITVPTIAATCAATSEAIAIYTLDHTFDSVAFLKRPAVHTFIDADILVKAPSQYFWAGMGDTIAKHYETHMATRGRDLSYNVQVGLSLSKMCAEPIFAHGREALTANEQGERNRLFDELVMAVVLTTGIVSGCMPGDFNSTIAHAVCYGCAEDPHTEEHHLHGEMVAYGLLVLFAADKQDEELSRWLPVYRQIGWPTKLSDMGLTKEHIPMIVKKASSVRDVVISPYVVTEELLTEAILKVEAHN